MVGKRPYGSGETSLWKWGLKTMEVGNGKFMENRFEKPIEMEKFLKLWKLSMG